MEENEKSRFEKKIRSLELEINRLKQDTENYQRFINSVFSNLNHEIRNPLNGILGFSEIISDESVPCKDRQMYTGLITESSLQLLSIITDVLDISKIYSGNFHTYSQKFDLNDLMFQLYQNYKPIAEKKSLQLFLENVISNVFVVESDPVVIERVFKKLIDNALKFTKQGWVKFYYKVENKHVDFYVEDTGIGIDENQREMIFEKFTMQPVSQTRNLGGSGLDLSLCHGLVGLLGGKITLLPPSGQGSVFKFSIPCAS